MKRLRLVVICFFVTGLVVVVQGQTPDGLYQNHLRAATHEAGEGNIPAAMADIQAAIALDANGPLGWYQLGSLLGQTGDFAGAEAALRHAIALQPGLAKAHYGLALALIGNPQGKQDWPGAIAECRAALKLQPDYAEALNLLGAGLNNTGQSEAAVPVLKQAIALSPSLAEAHFNLALALENNNQLDQAAQEYKTAVATKGVYAEASSALGKLLLRMNMTSAAEQEVRAALKLNPDLIDAHYTFARILRSEKRLREAEVEFAEAKDLTERPSNGIQSSQLSNAALQTAAKSDLAGAAEILRKAIVLKPGYGVPHYNLGLILADTGDIQGALQELAKAISLLPGQPKPWFDYGRVLELAKNNRNALEAMTWAAYLSPSDAAIHAELVSLKTRLSPDAPPPIAPAKQPAVGAPSDTASGHLAFAAQLHERGDDQGAVGELLRSLALEPARVDARRSLADAYLHLRQNERAELEYNKILLVDPDDVRANVSLGKLLMSAGDIDGALQHLRLADRLRPDSPEIRTALGEALRRSAMRGSEHR